MSETTLERARDQLDEGRVYCLTRGIWCRLLGKEEEAQAWIAATETLAAAAGELEKQIDTLPPPPPTERKGGGLEFL